LPTRTAAVGLATAMTASLAVAMAGAPPAAAGCPYEVYYSLSSKAIRMPFRHVPTFKNGPGGQVSATRGYSGSVSFTVTAGAETEVGAVFAHAKASISASLALSNSTSTTITYSHAIRRGYYGHLQYVSWGRKVHWTKYRTTPRCTAQVLARGTINFPGREEGWYFWQTRT